MKAGICNLLKNLVDTYCAEFCAVIRDKGVMLFVFILPVVYPIIYSLIYNPEVVRNVKVIVVDDDHTNFSRRLTRNLDATPEVEIIGYASNLNEAKQAMNNQACFGILHIPESCSQNVQESKESVVIMYCDMSLLLRYKAILMATTNVALDMNSNVIYQRLSSQGANMIVSKEDLDFVEAESVVIGNTTEGFDSFLMPGVLILILQQCIVLAIGMRGGAMNESINEKSGFGKNINPQSLKISTIGIFGKTICYLTLFMPSVLFLTYYVPLIFSFPMAGDYVEILIFLFPMVSASIFLGLAVQRIVRERETIFMIWVVTSVIFLFLSGLTWPRYAMSWYWQMLGALVPATWGIEGFVRMTSLGASLSQAVNPYIMLWSLVLFYLALNILFSYIFSRTRKKKRLNMSE